METRLVEPTVGILGAGKMGMALAKRWVESGHLVFLGSRNVPRAQEFAATLGPNAFGVSYQQAAAEAGVVVLTIPPHAVLEIVRDHADFFQDKTLMDCSASAGPMNWEDRHARASLAEQVAECAPGSRVIKALTTIPSATIAVARRPPVKALYCGDDGFAKNTIHRLIAELELEPIDAGPLSEARLFEYYASRAEWNAS